MQISVCRPGRLALTLALVLSLPSLRAQVSSARLEGRVQDPTGAGITRAQLTVTNARTQLVTKLESNAEGAFIFASLPPSVYTLTAEAAGFRRTVIHNLELYAATTLSQNVMLELGSVSDSVTVEATSERVQVADAQFGQTVTLKQIDTLPALGRGPLAIAVFSTGISTEPGDVSYARVNGMRQGSNNTRLDGIDANDPVAPRFGLSQTPVNLDSVEEMRVITNGFKAEYGRSAGGQVEMITRSGGSRWSGNLFEYLRNTSLNANTFFNNASRVERPKFIQNIFGGSLGGPVLKDRTFIFGNWQSRRTSQGASRNRTVYTPEIKAGQFRWRSAAGQPVQTFDMFRADPRGIGIDPKVKETIAIMPDPNNFDVGDGLNTGGFRFNVPATAQEDQYTVKVDHSLSSNHRLFYRHSRQDQSSIDTLNGHEMRYPGRPQGTQAQERWGFSIGSDWMLRPNLINETRFGYRSATSDFVRPDRQKGPGLDFATVTDPINLAFAQNRNSPIWDITNNVTLIQGKSTWKFGVGAKWQLQFAQNEAGIYPNVVLSRNFGNVPTGIGPATGIASADRQRFEELYNELLGRVSSISQTFYSNLETFQPAGTPRTRNFNYRDYGLFFQNDYKLNRRLTLNFGLRWDYMGSPSERDGLQGSLDRLELVNPAGRLSDLKVLRAPRWYNNDYNNFAPRFGFAWDPFGTGRTSIRGGYGIFYDRIVSAASSSVDSATPGFAQALQTLNGADFGPDARVNSNPRLPRQPAAPVLQYPVDRQSSITIFDSNLRTGYAQHFNLQIQREVVRNMVVEVGWVRTRGMKLFAWLDINQPRIYGDFLTSFQELERFRTSATPVSPTNTIARLFGSAQAAVTALGAATLRDGLAGAAADTVDRVNYQRYAGIALSPFYIRNFPQYNQVWSGGNGSRSWYDSLQTSLRRTMGSLKFSLNYTWSKAIDTLSADGNGTTSVIDNYNLNQFRGRGDFDRPHIVNYTTTWDIPVGRNRRLLSDMPAVLNGFIGGWEVGLLGLYQSGSVFTVTSGRRTTGATLSAWTNFTGDRTIGEVQRTGSGVLFFTPEQISQFSFPTAGETGSSGRNTFRGPGLFNMDASLVKRFPLPWEKHRVTFRAEMYNLMNRANFDTPGASLATPQSLGRISATSTAARVVQLALRYDF
ncbi:MAG: carboxypeptidase regulatory-like domain-containing protein [Bryobacterales bacterium]|nr:carboxypeptidase regulatory-like domain-containing protein [Bryobacterales bacterium]